MRRKTFTAEWINFMIISSKSYLLSEQKKMFSEVSFKKVTKAARQRHDYMNKIIERFHIDIAVYRSSSTDAIQKKEKLQKYDHISRNGIFPFLVDETRDNGLS